MMEKRLVKVLTPDQVIRFLGIVLAILLGLGGLLYWQGHVSGVELILLGIIALVAAVFFIFGTRITQRDGFLDGYARAKDDLDRKKE